MKGFWFTIEAVIACFIIALFLIFLARSYSVEGPGPGPAGSGYRALAALDDQGSLRSFAVSGDYSGIEDSVSVPGYYLVANICGAGGDCQGPTPNSTNVWVESYFLSGDYTYQPMEVKLLMWK